MVEAIFLLCAISPGYMTSGLQEQYIKRLRRIAPFAYIKTLTRTAGGRPIVAIQLGCGCTKVLVTGTHHANESIDRNAFVGAAAHLLPRHLQWRHLWREKRPRALPELHALLRAARESGWC